MTKKAEIQLDRLHILWEFATMFKIPKRKWDFREANNFIQNNGFDCGTAGCLMGEFPLIWKEWKYNPNSASSDLSYKRQTHHYGVEVFFGLTFEEYHHVFDFGTSRNSVYEGSIGLKGSATRKEVIDNLKIFIDKACANELVSQKEEF